MTDAGDLLIEPGAEGVLLCTMANGSDGTRWEGVMCPYRNVEVLGILLAGVDERLLACRRHAEEPSTTFYCDMRTRIRIEAMAEQEHVAISIGEQARGEADMQHVAVAVAHLATLAERLVVIGRSHRRSGEMLRERMTPTTAGDRTLGERLHRHRP